MEKTVTVTNSHELPELPPGTPKFITQQAKDMERVIARIEKEDSYDLFRDGGDPIDNLIGSGGSDESSGDSGAEGEATEVIAPPVVGAAAADAPAAAAASASPTLGASSTPAATRGWLTPARSKSPVHRQTTPSSPTHAVGAGGSSDGDGGGNGDAGGAPVVEGGKADGVVGGWETPADRRRPTPATEPPGGDGVGGGGRGTPSRKRPRKGAEALAARKGSSGSRSDSPPPLPPRPPPPVNPMDVQEQGKSQGVLEQGKCQGALTGIEQQQQQPLAATSLSENGASPQCKKTQLVPRRAVPMNLPQIRERFVSGHYLPLPGSYLCMTEAVGESGGATLDASSTGAPATSTGLALKSAKPTSTSKISICAPKATNNDSITSPPPPRAPPEFPQLPPQQRQQQQQQQQQQQEKEDTHGKKAAMTAAVAASASATAASLGATPDRSEASVATATVTTLAAGAAAKGEGETPPSEGAPPKPKVEPLVALTQDGGRLGEGAKLTFEYEPLLDWAGLRADLGEMVARMLRGAEEWRAEKKGTVGGKGCGGSGVGESSGGGARTDMEVDEEQREDDDESDSEIEPYLEKAKRFLASAEDIVTKQQERAEKEVLIVLYS